jgi:hypothetical protein
MCSTSSGESSARNCGGVMRHTQDGRHQRKLGVIHAQRRLATRAGYSRRFYCDGLAAGFTEGDTPPQAVGSASCHHSTIAGTAQAEVGPSVSTASPVTAPPHGPR